MVDNLYYQLNATLKLIPTWMISTQDSLWGLYPEADTVFLNSGSPGSLR